MAVRQCVVTCGLGDRMRGKILNAPSLFAAAAEALRDFDYWPKAPVHFEDNEIMTVLAGSETFYVRVGRVREWGIGKLD